MLVQEAPQVRKKPRPASRIEPFDEIAWINWIWKRPMELAEQGVDIYPLLYIPVGLPGENVLEASAKAARENPYMPFKGLLELREAIADKVERENNYTADPEDNIQVVNGAMNGFHIALNAILDVGDEVIIPTPSFYYWQATNLVGGKAVCVPGSEADDWRWDLEAIEAAITPRTKAIIIVEPNNPTGHVASMEELTGLADIAQRHGLYVLEDETYEKFVYDDNEFVSIASLPGMEDYALVINSFHKNYLMHAWRLGYVYGPKEVMNRVNAVATWSYLRVNYTSQMAGTACLTGPQDWVKRIPEPFHIGQPKFVAGLKDNPGISMVTPKGCTLGFLNVTRLGMDHWAAAEFLLEKYGIVTTPGTATGPYQGNEVNLRIGLGESPERPLEGLFERLNQAAEEAMGR